MQNKETIDKTAQVPCLQLCNLLFIAIYLGSFPDRAGDDHGHSRAGHDSAGGDLLSRSVSEDLAKISSDSRF